MAPGDTEFVYPASDVAPPTNWLVVGGTEAWEVVDTLDDATYLRAFHYQNFGFTDYLAEVTIEDGEGNSGLSDFGDDIHAIIRTRVTSTSNNFFSVDARISTPSGSVSSNEGPKLVSSSSYSSKGFTFDTNALQALPDLDEAWLDIIGIHTGTYQPFSTYLWVTYAYVYYEEGVVVLPISRKESSSLKDTHKTSPQKDLDRESVSYQDQRGTTSKMGPVSSTVEGSK